MMHAWPCWVPTHEYLAYECLFRFIRMIGKKFEIRHNKNVFILKKFLEKWKTCNYVVAGKDFI